MNQSSVVAKKRGMKAPIEAPKAEFSWDQSRTPNFTPEQVKTFLDASLGQHSGYYASYMFTGDKNSGHQLPIGRGCHGYIHSTPINGGYISALRYKDQTELNPETVDEASRWYIEKFLLGKYSPWACLLPYLTIVYNRDKLPVAFIVDGDENKKAIDKYLLQNFNIASRWPREFPGTTQGMFDLWLSGLFKKNEALLLQNLIRFNPATGAFTTIPNGRVGGGHHFYTGAQTYRILERKPNTGMIYKDARFCAVTGAMSSHNDEFVWGHDNRDTVKLQKMFDELVTGKLGKKTITRFGGVLLNISEESVKDFMGRFRELYESEFKRVPGGAFKDEGNMPKIPLGQDYPERYIGAYRTSRDVASKF